MGNASFPIELRATLLAERRHYFAQFRMKATAVVALVVIFDYGFPVGLYVVANRRGDA